MTCGSSSQRPSASEPPGARGVLSPSRPTSRAPSGHVLGSPTSSRSSTASAGPIELPLRPPPAARNIGGMDQPERAPIASVETVREELRRLGYLDSSLDRFVLGGAGGRSPFRASLRAAARVGLLGGVLFGLSGTLTAAALDARLRAEPQDRLVLPLYLLVAFGLVTAFAALAGGFLADWAGRRLDRHPGPTLPRNVGFVIGLAGLVYLGLWWRSHLAGGPLLPQAVALGLGLGLSLTLGRFGSLAAVAVLSAGGAGARLPPASLSRRHGRPLMGVAGVAC